LVVDVYKNERKIEIPDYKLLVNNRKYYSVMISLMDERDNWFEVENPQTFDVLLFYNPVPSHIGIYDKKFNGVLHAVEKTGVVFQRLNDYGMDKWLKIKSFRRKLTYTI